MKEWEFSNHVETNVHAALPEDWLDKPEASRCPPGWMLIEPMSIEARTERISERARGLYKEFVSRNPHSDPHRLETRALIAALIEEMDR